MSVPPGVLLVAASLGCGLVGLAPARGRLGRWGYHLAAFPLGLAGWALAASVAACAGGFTVPVVAGSLATWTAALAATTWRIARRLPPGEAVPWWSTVLAVTGTLAAAWGVARVGIATYSADGWQQYELLSMLLADTGHLDPSTVGRRMLLPLGLHAGNRAFGGELLYVVFPVLALYTAVILGWAVSRSARSRGRGSRYAAVGVCAAALMATTSSFAFHATFLHTHMLSAMYLLLAVVALAEAFEPVLLAGTGTPSAAWLAVAGVATAALVLARPDGPAYGVLLVASAAALFVRTGWDARAVLAFWAPLCGVFGVVFGLTWVPLGAWTSDKLDWTTGMAFVALYAAAAAVPWVASRTEAAAWLRAGTNTLRALAIVSALALAAIAAIRPEGVAETLAYWAGNLLVHGGWQRTWPFAAGVGILVAALPAWRRRPFTPYVLYSVAQFLAIALAIHSLTQPGRPGWGDSFNRVAFHVVPLVFLLFGRYAGAVLEDGVDGEGA